MLLLNYLVPRWRVACQLPSFQFSECRALIASTRTRKPGVPHFSCPSLHVCRIVPCSSISCRMMSPQFNCLGGLGNGLLLLSNYRTSSSTHAAILHFEYLRTCGTPSKTHAAGNVRWSSKPFQVASFHDFSATIA